MTTGRHASTLVSPIEEVTREAKDAETVSKVLDRLHFDRRPEEVTFVHRCEVVAAVPARDGHDPWQRLAHVVEGQSDGVTAVHQPLTPRCLAVMMDSRDVAGQSGEFRGTRDHVSANDVGASNRRATSSPATVRRPSVSHPSSDAR